MKFYPWNRIWCWIRGHEHRVAGDYSMCWHCGQIKPIHEEATVESEKKDIAMWVTELEAKVQALEAERDKLREAVKEYIEWHGSSCDDHVGDVYPDCPACQTDARLTQALGGGDE